MRVNSQALRRRCCTVLLSAVLGAVSAQAVCNTPPVTVDDAAKTVDEPVLIDALANDFDGEGQALVLTVDGTTCSGSVSVDMELITLTPAARLYEDCTIAYTVTDGGGLTDSATITVTIPSEIFADGFESGNTAAWSL